MRLPSLRFTAFYHIMQHHIHIARHSMYCMFILHRYVFVSQHHLKLSISSFNLFFLIVIRMYHNNIYVAKESQLFHLIIYFMCYMLGARVIKLYTIFQRHNTYFSFCNATLIVNIIVTPGYCYTTGYSKTIIYNV